MEIRHFSYHGETKQKKLQQTPLAQNACRVLLGFSWKTEGRLVAA